MATLKFKKADRNTTGYWWFILLAGILFIILGLRILATPVASYLSLSSLFAIGMIMTGILEGLFSITNTRFVKRRGMILTGGVIDFLLGIYLLYYPLLTMVIMPVILGPWVLYWGFMTISNSTELKDSGMSNRRCTSFTGILIIVCALIILGTVLFGIINIVIWTAISLITAGISRIYLALKLLNFQTFR